MQIETEKIQNAIRIVSFFQQEIQNEEAFLSFHFEFPRLKNYILKLYSERTFQLYKKP